MKKILGALVCALTLFGASVQAEAAPIESSYDIVSATVSTTNDNVIILDTISASWGDNALLLEEKEHDPTSFGTLEISGSLFTPPNSFLENLFSVTFNIDLMIEGEKFSIPLTVDFSAFNSNGSEYLSYDFSSPLPTLTAANGTEYTLSRDLILTYDGSTIVDSTELPGMDFPNALSWNVTDNAYSMSLDLKVTENAPTPEPATMLLMGLGLAGLGLVARRRK